MLKHLIDIYGGNLLTIRQHIMCDTSIAQYMYGAAGVPNTTRKGEGEYIEQRNEYVGYVGELGDRANLPILVGGVAEMLAKIMLIRELGIPEWEIYDCPAIGEAVTALTECTHSLSFRGMKRAMKAIGSENFRALNDRLDDGYVWSFDICGDGMMNRALLLFQLMAFHKYHELGWFAFMGCLSNPDVAADIEKLAKRIFDVFLPMIKGNKVDFFPLFGTRGKLTAMADLRIGDTIFLFSTLTKGQWENGDYYRSSVILNTCAQLAKQENDRINKKLVYHARWNAFTKIV